jgi:hypothetical protein
VSVCSVYLGSSSWIWFFLTAWWSVHTSENSTLKKDVGTCLACVFLDYRTKESHFLFPCRINVLELFLPMSPWHKTFILWVWLTPVGIDQSSSMPRRLFLWTTFPWKTKGLAQARQAFYNWATFPALGFWGRYHYIDQAGFEDLPACWDNRCARSCLAASQYFLVVSTQCYRKSGAEGRIEPKDLQSAYVTGLPGLCWETLTPAEALRH